MTEERIQEIFDKVQEKKVEISGLKKARKEQILIEIEGYELAAKKSEEATKAVREMEFKYDQRFPKLADDIALLTGENNDLADQLGSMILAALMKGDDVEIILKGRGDKKKIYRPRFKVGFEQQQSLPLK